MKVSFIYPIRDRKELFTKTLNSIREQNFDRNEVEFVVVDQGRDNLRETLKLFPFKFIYLRADTNRYRKYDIMEPSRPCATYLNNLAVRHASGINVVLTSPEVYHKGEVVQCFMDKLGKIVYVTVYDLTSDGETAAMLRKKYCDINRIDFGNYFLASIPRALYFEVDGMDEVYMRGQSLDDCEFGVKVGLTLPKYEYEFTDKVWGFHQEHSKVVDSPTSPSALNWCIFTSRLRTPRWYSMSREEQQKFLFNNSIKDWGNDDCLVSKEIIDGR